MPFRISYLKFLVDARESTSNNEIIQTCKEGKLFQIDFFSYIASGKSISQYGNTATGCIYRAHFVVVMQAEGQSGHNRLLIPNSPLTPKPILTNTWRHAATRMHQY